MARFVDIPVGLGSMGVTTINAEQVVFLNPVEMAKRGETGADPKTWFATEVHLSSGEVVLLLKPMPEARALLGI